MLETSSTTVNAVVREVGYEDASSFSRLFRRLTGILSGDAASALDFPTELGQVRKKCDFGVEC
ncbi:AraC-like DNA-binding protein [Phyllobacterium sp. 1468]|nr:AraC-like DNA-binding protein [Phyllobacterium sp. 1468]